MDFAIGESLRHFYFKQKRGAHYYTTYSIKQSEADILIFGSSRANRHYNSSIIENHLNLTCYNNGKDGQFIFYHYGILKTILNRFRPKIVILDFMFREFSESQTAYDRLAVLRPYYREHKELEEIVELMGPYEKLKLISKIYPYNSSLLIIAGGNEVFSKKEKEDIKGYLPKKGRWSRPLRIENNPKEYITDNNKIKYYESFIQDCIKSNIKLYVVCSPRYITLNNQDYSISIAKIIAKKYNIPFMDYSQDQFFLNSPSLFADEGHLNNDGAKKFSEIIAKVLEESQDL
jgi:hypothetical protein